ncbi:hypothetical protein [Rhodalgimonas zhirmunskyi]|uniref:Uncharacterized protein n=1 Tax=Rhodalgimonas zhirmunskyi TaxID=2964767 RepID=A0AAJ1U515_9RHOB|nr:hypothetical protein [Rhodoalgimonas zhirmunskyi]MDQ2093275.1 hypothetical protein [Rhodoalgimonas zhirmunskyi]
MNRRPALILCFLLPLWSAGCGDFPELDARLGPADQTADYPKLVPFGPILAQAGEVTVAQSDVEGVAGRAAALRARAARMRGPIIDRATRARMRRGVDTSGL